MKKIVWSVICLTFIAGLSSCFTTNYLTKGVVDYSEEMTRDTVLNGIITVLSEKNITISNANKDFGLIETDWVKVSDIQDNVGTSIGLAMLTGAPTTMYETYFKINFRITDDKYYVIPSGKTTEDTGGLFASKKDNVYFIQEKSDQASVVKEIVNEINELLDIQGEVLWEIETK